MQAKRLCPIVVHKEVLRVWESPTCVLRVALGGDGIVQYKAAHPESCRKLDWQQQEAGDHHKSKQMDWRVQGQDWQPDPA